METSQLDPKLSLQPFDPEVFQRVWNRVMPDQDRSPIAMDAPAQPAVPALSPVPEQPPHLPQNHRHGIGGEFQSPAFIEGSRAARVLSGIAGDLRREERRLSTAHFLITGERYAPSQTGAVPSGPLPLALRTLFQQLHQRAAQARAAAQGMGDPCLQQLFQDLGEDAEFYAQRLRALLEGMP